MSVGVIVVDSSAISVTVVVDWELVKITVEDDSVVDSEIEDSVVLTRSRISIDDMEEEWSSIDVGTDWVDEIEEDVKDCADDDSSIVVSISIVSELKLDCIIVEVDTELDAIDGVLEYSDDVNGVVIVRGVVDLQKCSVAIV